MAIVPINPTLQKSYRDTLLIPAAPPMIDTEQPIMPVAIIAQASDPSVAQNMKVTDGTDTAAVSSSGGLLVEKRYFDPDDLFQADANVTGTTLTTVADNTTGGTVYIDEIQWMYTTTQIGTNGFRIGIYESNGTTLVVDLLDLKATTGGFAGNGTSNQNDRITVPIALENGRMIRVQNGHANDIIAVSVLGHKTN